MNKWVTRDSLLRLTNRNTIFGFMYKIVCVKLIGQKTKKLFSVFRRIAEVQSLDYRNNIPTEA